MKRMTQSLSILLAGLMLVLAGCREITTTTVVHPDGGITRIIETEGDSTLAQDVAYPIPTGEGWDKAQRQEKVNGEEKTIWTFTKRFPSIISMLGEMAEIADQPRRIKLSTDLIKRVRWFYTYTTYREAVGSYNVFPVPVSDFLTSEELLLKAAHDSTTDKAVLEEIDAKYERWQAHAILELLYQGLKTHAGEAGMPAAAEMESRKDVLLGDLVRAVDLDEAGFDLDVFLTVAAKSLGAPAVLNLTTAMTPVWEDLEARLEFMQSVEEDSYVFRVEMPGIILDTNADGIEGNRAYWKVNHSQFLDQDYVMEVTSRTANRWALVVTGLVGLAALLVLVVPLIRKKR